MSSVDDLLGQLDPVLDDEVARLEARIRAQATEQRGLKVLLNQLEAPPPVALSRLEARLSATIAVRRRRAGLVRRWTPAGVAVAALALVVGLSWSPAPSPVSAGTLPLDGISQLQPLDEVVLDYGGLGEATWDGKVVRIDWEEGTLTSSVTPKQGIDLSVHTREAVVSVVGTAFTVTRDADGSHVSVEHGVVAVDCEGSDSVTLRVGEAHTCGPVSAGQWLVQIDRLFASASASERIRTSIRRGIRYSVDGDPLRGELLAREVQLLLRDGDRSEAAAVARQYLDEGYTVRAQQLLPVTELTP
jgi:ferric-dicitrate binding protein FerR (iron transport regulator)